MSELTQRIAQLSREERIKLEERLLATRRNGHTRIARRTGTGPASLSYAQERLWFLAQLEPDSAAYNEMQVIRLSGTLDIDALERSLDAIAARHDSLRVCFREIDGSIVQLAQPLSALRIPLVDLTDVPAELQMSAAERHIRALRNKLFDMTQAPLWRVMLIRLADESHIFVRVIHHVISDGWSNSIFRRELSHLYSAHSSGSSAQLPELPISYQDFSVWQRQWLQGERLERLVGYWQERLADLQPLNLPTDRPRPPKLSHSGDSEIVSFDQTLSRELAALARTVGASIYMLLLAAFQVLLHRYSNQNDIAIGSPIANRTRPEIEGIHGFFANTLVMRTDCGDNPPFLSLLANVRENALGAYQHQDLPFEKLVEELRPRRYLNRNPLFDIVFAFQNTPESDFNLRGMELNRLSSIDATAKFDISLSLSEASDGLHGQIKYATDLFDASTIRRMVLHFETLLKSIIANPHCPIDELPLLTTAEYQQIVHKWNDTIIDFDDPRHISALFEQQVAATPNAVALVFEGAQLTYAELNIRANQLAHHLRTFGVGPDVLVAVAMERSTEMVASLLAILKAGGAFVPIDPANPRERIQYMLLDCTASILLTQSHLSVVDSLPPSIKDIIAVDQVGPELACLSAQNPNTEISPLHLAYAIYTSGSTGKPKAAMIEHRGIANSLLWRQRTFHLGQEDGVLHKAALSFDVAMWEIFWPLTVGARLIVACPDYAHDPAYLQQVIRSEQITFIHFVPSSLTLFLNESGVESCSSLRWIWSAGEQLSADLWHLFRSKLKAELYNGYGLAETSTVVTYFLCVDEKTQRPIPIGRPIANTSVYVLDAHRQLVPVGVAGELFVGGPAVGRGYLARPELSGEHFVEHPAFGRLYKTGDICRWLAEGSLEFVGRSDFQVKIRGFRVEPGEVEAILHRHPAVRESKVGVLDNANLGKRLVAWWIAQPGEARQDVDFRAFLCSQLPDYMLPSHFVRIDAFPLNANGKVDMRQLPEPVETTQATPSRSPQTPLEHQLLAIWQNILGVQTLGVDSDFFILGGHSLLATQVVSRIRDAFQIALPLRTFFEQPTIEALAKNIEDIQWHVRAESATFSIETSDGEEGEL